MVLKLSKNEAIPVESNVWYLDNGAHMTGQLSKFKEIDEKVTGQVQFGDGSTVDIKGKGSVVFKSRNGDEVIFSEVYYIPTLCNNIISLGQLSKNGNTVVLKGNFLWVYDEQRRLIMKVKRSANRLYKIIIDVTSGKIFLAMAFTSRTCEFSSLRVNVNK